jgi:hypothetical protein
MAPVNANPLRVITRVICGTGDCAQGDENIKPRAVRGPGSADRHAAPWAGTNVQCTGPRERRIFGLSSSGGGLFGRPVTLRSLGRFLIFGRQFLERAVLRGRLRWQKRGARPGSWASRIENPSLVGAPSDRAIGHYDLVPFRVPYPTRGHSAFLMDQMEPQSIAQRPRGDAGATILILQ